MPKISVIIPVFNAEKYLKSSIDSILNQTEKDIEIIVINDGSTDNSLEILNNLQKLDSRIKVISRENRGVIESLNEAIKNSSGKYIARMDADDISFKDRLEKQFNYMEKNNLDLCGTSAITINEKGEEIGKIIRPENKKEIMKFTILHNPFIHPSVMFRREIVEKIGLYKKFKHAEDYEFWTRIVFKYNVANIQEPLLYYRIHENQITKKKNTHMVFTSILVRFLALFRFIFIFR